LSGNTWVSRYQKGKTSLNLLEQEIVSGIGISWAIYMQICTSPQTDSRANTAQPWAMQKWLDGMLKWTQGTMYQLGYIWPPGKYNWTICAWHRCCLSLRLL